MQLQLNKAETVKRLNALQRAQRLVWYRGDIDPDINHALKGAPTYAALLRHVQQTANALATAQRISLTTEPEVLEFLRPQRDRDGNELPPKTVRVRINRYIATGI